MAFGEGSSSRVRVEPGSLVFATAEEPSTGKGLASNNELIDCGDVAATQIVWGSNCQLYVTPVAPVP